MLREWLILVNWAFWLSEENVLESPLVHPFIVKKSSLNSWIHFLALGCTWACLLLNFCLVEMFAWEYSQGHQASVAIDSQSLTHNARCGCLKTQLGRGLFALLNIWGFFSLKWHITVKNGIFLKSERMSYSFLPLQHLVLFMAVFLNIWWFKIEIFESPMC